MTAPLDRIREFIRANLTVFDDAATLDDDDHIFERGFVDSMFALQLVTFVEGEFGVVVDDEDLNLANFKSVNAVHAFLERKGAV